ncbi:MAG: single-stranded-DNA-specific exonuclease [Patescibacteria group bacterium]|nr:single-stranded-DNA-specific exonuclease [Patescibacteria group bacterium]
MKEWRLLPKIEPNEELMKLGLNPLLLQIMLHRGFTTVNSINNFLNFKLDENLVLAISEEDKNGFYNPFIFKDMEEAVKLIITHIKRRDLIIVYGDYDADGVTSAVILYETLRLLQAKVEVYLPDRVSEGYGLNKMAINQIAQAGAKLVVTVDTGIRSKEEVAYAQSLGLDVIITDHHVLPEKLTELPACLIINPADTRNNYPCPFLAGVGVSYKLISALLIKSKLSPKQKQLLADKALDLVALGTIADMVSLLDENRLLVKKGLEIMNRNQRLGLNQLLFSAGINTAKDLEAWNIGWQIAPRLNAASRLSHANTAFSLLTTKDKEEARELAEELNRRNSSRQEITKEIMSQVEEKINQDNVPEIIIGVCDDDQAWNEGVIGLVAGKIAEKYYRPTLIITRLVEVAEFDSKKKKLIPKQVSFKGSGRSIPELNLIKTIEENAIYLDKYGGHPMACGFSLVSEEKLKLFIDRITRLVKEKLANVNLVPKIDIEAVLKKTDIKLDFAQYIEKLAPFGQNNSQPKFVSYNFKVEDIIVMGMENQHIKLRLDGFWAISFGGAKKYEDIKVGDRVDLVYYLEINKFNGHEGIQLKIIDLKLRQ